MEAWLDTLTQWLAGRPGWILAAIALVAFLESLAIAGIVVPGVAILFAIAMVAGGSGLSVWAAMGWAAFGAVLGDGVSFALGKVLKERVHRIWPFTRYPAVLSRGERFFRQYGGISVVLGRFIGPIRPVIPLVAGMFNMPSRQFLLFNVASALGWAPAYILPGFLVGASLAADIVLPAHFYLILGAGLVVLVALFWLLFNLHLALVPEGRIYRWLRRRAPAGFWQAMSRPRPGQQEFPLASLTLAVGSLALFTLWTLLHLETDWLEPANQAVAHFFSVLRNPLTDPFFLALTLAGDSIMLWWGFGLGVAWLLGRGQGPAAIHLALAGFAILLLTHGLKAYWDLARPPLVASLPESAAYPSGHASGNTVLFGLLAAFLGQELPARKRWRVYTLAAMPVFAIGLSRLYLGVHWLTDVVGGLLLGLTVCGWIRFSYSRLDHQPLHWHHPTTLVAAAAWLIALAAYLALAWPEAQQAYSPRISPPAP